MSSKPARAVTTRKWGGDERLGEDDAGVAVGQRDPESRGDRADRRAPTDDGQQRDAADDRRQDEREQDGGLEEPLVRK